MRNGVDVHLTGEWKNEGNIYLKGHILSPEGNIANVDDFGLLRTIYSQGDLEEFLIESTGQFALIIDDSESIVLCSDQMSTIRLFYHISDSRKMISNSYYWIEEKLPSSTVPNELLVESLQYRFVPGKDTFHPGIAKVEPGQIIKVDKASTDFNEKSYFSFRPEHLTSHQIKKENLRNDFHNTLNNVFQRLSKIKGERPIILRFSGGYDSRLIAYYLQENEFDDVILYSQNLIGDENHHEYIANQLGFEYFELSHSRDDIKNFFKSKDWWEIENLYGGYGSVVPRLMLNLSLKKIKEKSTYPSDGIVLTGHSPFHGGDKIPEKYLKNEFLNRCEIFEDIVTTFSHNDLNTEREDILLRQLKKRYPGSDEISSIQSAALIDHWYTIEKCAHKSIAHYYEYEHWGFERWLPFFDKEVLNFYSQLPIDLRYGRTFLESYVEVLDRKKLSEPNRVIPSNHKGRISKSKSYIKDQLEEIIPTSLHPSSLQTHLIKNNWLPHEQDIRLEFMSDNQIRDNYTSENHMILLLVDTLSRSDLSIPSDVPYDYKFDPF